MTFKKILSGFATLSISVLGLIITALPASAIGPSASITPDTFATSSTTPALTISVPSTGSAISSWMEIYVSFSNTSNVAWTIALSTCTMGAPQPLSACGIQSISVGGTPVSDAVVKKQGNMVSISRPLNAQNQQQFFTNATSNEVIISVGSGVFNTPGTAGTNYQASVMYNGTSAPSIAPAPVTLSSSLVTVTFDANGGSGSMSSQSATIATALTSNSFSNDGYTFGGWATSQSNATAGTVAYTNGASYPFTSSATLYAIWTANGGNDTLATANLTMNASTGSLVAGSTVAIVASGLQSSAPYTVTVQSTPQTIGTGTASNGSVNSSVTIPSGLETGWHTLTFTSTAADGSAVESKLYFQISSTGTLLESTSTIPAALANTGTDAATPLGIAGVLLLAGAALVLIRRRLVK